MELGRYSRRRWWGAAQESLAIGMVGDGLVAFLMPERHVRLWAVGPAWWRRFVNRSAQRPWVIRGAALAALMGGLWWARHTQENYAPAGWRLR